MGTERKDKTNLHISLKVIIARHGESYAEEIRANELPTGLGLCDSS